MRTEALNHKYVYGSPLQTSRLVVDVADKHQRCTQSYVRRPYGVGLLVRRRLSSWDGLELCGLVLIDPSIPEKSPRPTTLCLTPTPLLHYSNACPQIASYDQTGPHLYQTDPSGNYYEYLAQAIGARAQSGKTYLEKHFAEFEGLGVDDLIKHALKALSGTTGQWVD